MVSSYKYLGIIISNTCNINKMIEDRMLKANRAAFLIRQASVLDLIVQSV